MRRFVSWETAEEIVIDLHAAQLLPACGLLISLCRRPYAGIEIKPMSLSKVLRDSDRSPLDLGMYGAVTNQQGTTSKVMHPDQTTGQNWRKVGVGRLDASGLSAL